MPPIRTASGSIREADARGVILRTITPSTLDFAGVCNWPDNILGQPGVFWRRTLWEQCGGLNPQLACAMDFDLWLRFAQIAPGGVLRATVATAQQHPAMKSRRFAARAFVETCLCLDRHGASGLAAGKLERVVRRAFAVDCLFSWITRHPLYRRWRDNREMRRRDC